MAKSLFRIIIFSHCCWYLSQQPIRYFTFFVGKYSLSLLDFKLVNQQVLFFCETYAASLGQVYKGRLKENGDRVAVKVQRPFVLETVTVDLFIIRNLGLALKKFPQAS